VFCIGAYARGRGGASLTRDSSNGAYVKEGKLKRRILYKKIRLLIGSDREGPGEKKKKKKKVREGSRKKEDVTLASCMPAKGDGATKERKGDLQKLGNLLQTAKPRRGL